MRRDFRARSAADKGPAKERNNDGATGTAGCFAFSHSSPSHHYRPL